MALLAIETSCDETAVAIMDLSGKLLTSLVRSQEKEHAPYGGIVPEIASRAHSTMLLPLVEKSLRAANLAYDDLSAIAVTAGPGLLGSLLVGISTAKSLALALNIPLIAVDHLEAHIAAAFIEAPEPEFPLLAAVVSGGHSAIYALSDFGALSLLGATQDDAMGEAYDKIAAKLGLGYPGGPIIDRLSASYQGELIELPIPMQASGNLNFSFSGLKTAVIQRLQRYKKLSAPDKVRFAASFQAAAIETLMGKLLLAVKLHANAKQLVVCGGVACNRALRQRLTNAPELKPIRLMLPPAKYCTDNAAMIAKAALYQYQKQQFSGLTFSPYTHAALSPRLVSIAAQ